ncbi:MAG: P-loop NTPase [Bdellovibrionales bacterium]|nr:P-loop NTPase [Bdellovibrionales bacterium]
MSRRRHEDNHNYQLRGVAQAGSHIIAVGGGKGGVGKSFVSSNIAIFLANMGYKTTLVDLDLGSANLHTYMGQGQPQLCLGDVARKKSLVLEDVAIPTQFPNLSLVSGANDSLHMADANMQELTNLMRAVFYHQTDFTILDLSAGTHNTTLDFFLMAHDHVVTVTPEPSSVENAYRFMKACFYRKVRRFERQLHITKHIQKIMANSQENGVKSPADLLYVVSEKDQINGHRLKEVMAKLQFELIVNQARTPADHNLGGSMKTIIERYFGLPARFLGHLEYSDTVWQSLRKHRPLLLEYPHTPLYNQLLRVTRNIAAPAAKKIVV